MHKKTFLIIMVVIIIITAGILRLINSGEDAWVCDNGQWVEHGHPSAEKPQSACGEEKIDLTKEPVQEVKQNIGGNKDQYGCLSPAGYTWCEEKQKCLRAWEEGCEITVITPQANDMVTSPLTISGEAKGNWFFEAVIPIKLVDKDNNIILNSYAQTQESWMTEDFVSFEAILDFTTTATSGYLVIEKNNPSDLKNLDNLFRVPVIFK